MSRVQSEEVVDVAVLVFRVIDVFRPFHQLTVAAHFVGSQMCQHFLPLFTFLAVHSEYFACFNGILQNFADYGVNESGSFVNRSMFG